MKRVLIASTLALLFVAGCRGGDDTTTLAEDMDAMEVRLENRLDDVEDLLDEPAA